MTNMEKGWTLHEVESDKEENIDKGFSLSEKPTLEELLEKINGKLGSNPEKGVDWEMDDEVFIYLSIEDGTPVIVIEDLNTGAISNNRIENDSDIDEMLATKIVPKAMIVKANENKPEAIAI